MTDFVANFDLEQNNIEADFELENVQFDAVFEINPVGATWGGITGQLSAQTDLQNALDGKQDVITDLDTIRADAEYGASAYLTISSYGDIVTYNASDFATVAQGTLAETAVQPGDLAIVATSGSYNDLLNKPTIPTVNNATLTIQKNSTDIDTFTANASVDKIINIQVPVNASDVNALPSSTKYGASIDVSLNTTDYKLTISLKDQDGTTLNSKVVDFPIESVVVNGSYDSVNQKIVLTLQNGNTIDIPVGALIAGLQTEITSNNKLDADLVDDSLSTNKFVTANDKTTWNGKQDAISDLSTIRSNATNGQSAYTTISGYGNIVTHNVSEFADSIQGGKADTALQPNDNISELVNDANYITSSDLPTVNDATLTIQANGTNVATFTANQSTDVTANITIPDSATWGNITGTLSDQTDLQTALNGKVDTSDLSEYTANEVETLWGSI